MDMKIKSIVVAGFCLGLILFPLLIRAETMYVTDVLRLAVRSAKGSDQGFLAVLKSGQTVEIIQMDDKWARVRLPDGKEGWVLHRYLTARETKGIILERLQKRYDALKNQVPGLIEENNHLAKENKRLRAELNQLEAGVKKVNMSYENLKTEAADYLNLKTEYEQAVAQLAEKDQQSEKLKEEIERLETRQMIRWFLTGAGVLFFGFIIGFSAKRQRRKPSFRV
ncbi:MAG: TIGR04211 family SH3 domain-containing protein [Desulfobacterales bacterium]|jgi:SH3 domain protein